MRCLPRAMRVRVHNGMICLPTRRAVCPKAHARGLVRKAPASTAGRLCVPGRPTWPANATAFARVRTRRGVVLRDTHGQRPCIPIGAQRAATATAVASASLQNQARRKALPWVLRLTAHPAKAPPRIARVRQRIPEGGSGELDPATRSEPGTERDACDLGDQLRPAPPRSPLRSINSILYPSGSVTKAITVVPPLTGPASRVTLPPAALIFSQAA